jgi:hypothetical protein
VPAEFPDADLTTALTAFLAGKREELAAMHPVAVTDLGSCTYAELT